MAHNIDKAYRSSQRLHQALGVIEEIELDDLEVLVFNVLMLLGKKKRMKRFRIIGPEDNE